MSKPKHIALVFVLAAGLAILLLPGAEVAQASSHPTISSVAITSTPTIDSDQDGMVDTYGVGENIEVTVAFNETVNVTGTPRLEIAVGSSNRQAAYNRGSGTASMVFRYTVVAADTDADGVSVAANKLTLNSGTIKDAADNAASLTHAVLAAHANHKVDGSKSPDTTGPTLSSATVNGTQLVLTYNEALGGALPHSAAFTVRVDGTTRTSAGLGKMVKTVDLTLSSAVTAGQTVTVSYDRSLAAPGSRIQDAAGNQALNLTNQAVTNITADTTPPTFVSAAVNGTELTITFNEDLDPASVPAPTFFFYQRDSEVTTKVPVSVAINGRIVTLTLSTANAVAHGQTVGLLYTKPVTNPLQDLAGNAVAGFSTEAVTNNTPAPAPVTIESVTIASAPSFDTDNDGAPDTYGNGDKIAVEVTFSEAVTVTGGTPRVRLDLGPDDTVLANSRRSAALASGSGTATLRFEYTVASGNTDADGVWVQTLSATDDTVVFLNGATIASTATMAAAELTKSGLPTSGDANHKVDGTRTPGSRVISMSIYASPASGDTYGVGETIAVSVRFSGIVNVTGKPQLEIAVGENNRQAVFSTVLHSINDTESVLFFDYPVVEGDLDTDGISIGANKLRLNGGTINDTNSNAAVLFHEPLATQSGHKVNGGPLAAPTLSSATAEGAELVLTYDEALAGPAPDKRAFTVRVDGRGRTVGSVALAGNAVTLTLTSAVREGQAVTVSYRAANAGGNPIRDAVGNQAADFTNRAVDVSPDTTAPTVVSAAVNGTELTITFSEDLDPDSPPVPDAFWVNQIYFEPSRIHVAAGGVVIGGRTVTLTLDTAVVPSQVLFSITYTKPATNPLRDRAATPNEVNSFTEGGANNTPDTRPDPESVPPELVVTERYRVYGETYLIRAVVYYDKLTLTYDEALDEDSTPAPGAFTVRESDGWGGELYGVASVAVADRTVTLTLSKGTSSGGVGRFEVSYRAADAGGNPIRDIWGNAAADFDLTKDETLVKATVYVTPAPNVSKAEASGRLLTLTFDRQLDFDWSDQEDGHGHPGPEQFVVTVDGVASTATKLQVGGRNPYYMRFVTLTLASPVSSGQTVTVSYYVPDRNWLRSAKGVPAPGFRAREVTVITLREPGKPRLDVKAGDRGVNVQAVVENGGSEIVRTHTIVRTASGASRRIEGYMVHYLQTHIGFRTHSSAHVFDRRTNDETYWVRVGVANDWNGDGVLDWTESDEVTVTPVAAVKGMSVSGNALTVRLNRELDSGSRPQGRAFEVTATPAGGGAPRTIRGTGTAAIVGDTVSVALASALADGERATVRYARARTGDLLRDADGGLEVADFSGDDDAAGDGPLEVTGVAVVSDAGADDTYHLGDTIRVGLVFGEAVEVTGAPRLKIGMGDGERWATYESGGGTAPLVFAYGPVAAGDNAPEGITVLADTLELNGGAIASKATGAAAPLGHAGLDADPAHRVDSVTAKATGVAIASDPGPDGAYGLGETIRVAATFSEAVDVDTAGGAPRLKIRMGAGYGEKWAAYESGGGTAELVFAFGPVAWPNYTDEGIAVLADTLEPNGGAIASQATGAAAVLGHPGLDHDPAHKVDHAAARDTGIPTVTAVAIASDAGPDDTYHLGETVRVAATFSEAVEVTGAPRLKIKLDPAYGEKWATYESGSGTASLVFVFGPVEEPDYSDQGIAVLADSLELNGGAVASSATGEAALLRHAGLAHDPAHRVGHARPTVTAVRIASDAGPDDTYRLGDTIRVRLDFGEAVEVDTAGGAPRLKIKMGPGYGEKWATYESGSGTAALVFVFGPVAEPDYSDQGIAVLADTLDLNGGAIASQATGAAAALGHAGLDHDPAHKVDHAPEPPTLSVGDRRAEEGGTLVFAVRLSEASDATVTVDYATSDGTATAGEDYTAALGTLTFYAGELARTIQVAALTDRAEEVDETFTVSLSNPSGATIADGEATGTVGYVAPPPAVTEVAVVSDAGPDDTYRLGDMIRVRLAFGEAVEVEGAPRLKIRMGAGYGEKWATYESGGGTEALVFAFGPVAWPNYTDQGIAVLADTLELNGGAIASQATSAAAALGHAGLDHDPAHKVDHAAPPPPTLSVGDARAEEGGTLAFTVRLSEADDAAVTVDYATAGGTATAGDDYTAASGTLTFAAGVLEQTVEVTALTDRTDEGDETFTMSLSNPSGATLADGEATGTVENVAPPLPTLSVADARAEEGGTLRFAVRLSEASDAAVTVDYATSGGTAASGDDYTAASGTLTFAAGVLEQTVEVTALTDRTDEGDETFTMSLSNPSGATLAGGEATGTVENVAPPPPTLSVADARAGEGGTLAFAVRLSEASDAAVTMDYATSGGTAASGDDYTAASGTLTFAAGVLEQTVEVTALTDRTDEGDETFTMSLSNPSGATLAGGEATGTVENVAPVTAPEPVPGRPTGLQVAAQPGSLDVSVDWNDVEGATSYLVRWRAAGPENDLNEGVEAQSSETTITVAGYGQWVVRVEACNDTGCGPSVARTVDVEQLPPGRPENFTVSTTPDSLSLSASWDPAEGASSYKLQWRKPDGAFGDNQVIATGTAASFTVSGYGQWVVRLEACNDGGCGPGATQTVDVEGTPPGQPENFNVSSTPGELSVSATWDPVEGASSYRLRWRQPDGVFGDNQVIAAGTAASFTVSEYGEWVVRLEACNDAGCGHPVARRLTVEDVAPPPPTLSVADARAEEGGVLRFAVRLSESTDAAVTVDYATSDGTATAGDDYTAASGTLTFAAGVLEQTIEVAALTDRAEEGDETFTVSLSNPSGATLADGEATGAVANVAPPNAPPVFNPGSYSFSIAESPEVWNPVGSVAATDPDAGDTITYHITAGNGAGRFMIDLNFGEILVWGALDYETVSSYTLTVEARDGNGGTATATAEINVTDVAE